LLHDTGNELTEVAHALAGSAGMFGFERLAAKGRSFERAVQSGAPEASTLADELCAAVDATLEKIRNDLGAAAI
jgi:HPt (histidine-containing phosphotransfer) domain-containing protein